MVGFASLNPPYKLAIQQNRGVLTSRQNACVRQVSHQKAAAVSEDFLKADPIHLIGIGLIGIAVPIFFPALRPQFAALLKAGAKLALEAEFDADDALADSLVNTALNTLLSVSPRDSDRELYDRSEATMNRFLAAASAGAARRGWDRQDAAKRYHKRLVKLDHAISRAHPRARPPQRTALDHALKLLREPRVISERRLVDTRPGSSVHSGTKPDHTSGRAQSLRAGTRA
jgi:hypothetical protein